MRTVWVDARKGCDDTGDGTERAPFRSPLWAVLHTTDDDRIYLVPTVDPQPTPRKLPATMLLLGLVATTLILLGALIGREL